MTVLSPQWDFLYWWDDIFILNRGPDSLPMRITYEMSFVSSSSDLCFTVVTELLFSMLCNIWLCWHLTVFSDSFPKASMKWNIDYCLIIQWLFSWGSSMINRFLLINCICIDLRDKKMCGFSCDYNEGRWEHHMVDCIWKDNDDS